MTRGLLVMTLCSATYAAAICLRTPPECVPDGPLRASFLEVLQPPCHDVLGEVKPARPADRMDVWVQEHAATALPFLVRVADACGANASAGRALNAMSRVDSADARTELERRLQLARGPFRSEVLRAVLDLAGEHGDGRLAEHVFEAQDPSELWLLVARALEFGGPASTEALQTHAAGERNEALRAAEQESSLQRSVPGSATRPPAERGDEQRVPRDAAHHRRCRPALTVPVQPEGWLVALRRPEDVGRVLGRVEPRARHHAVVSRDCRATPRPRSPETGTGAASRDRPASTTCA